MWKSFESAVSLIETVYRSLEAAVKEAERTAGAGDYDIICFYIYSTGIIKHLKIGSIQKDPFNFTFSESLDVYGAEHDIWRESKKIFDIIFEIQGATSLEDMVTHLKKLLVVGRLLVRMKISRSEQIHRFQIHTIHITPTDTSRDYLSVLESVIV